VAEEYYRVWMEFLFHCISDVEEKFDCIERALEIGHQE
jgi:hypothetical protein